MSERTVLISTGLLGETLLSAKLAGEIAEADWGISSLRPGDAVQRVRKGEDLPDLVLIDGRGERIWLPSIEALKECAPKLRIWLITDDSPTEAELEKINSLPHVDDDDLTCFASVNEDELVAMIAEDILVSL